MVKKSEKSKQKKQLIIETAASEFARKGFYGTVMGDIAKLAGIGKGTIYEYFSSKEDLFFSVFEWMNEEMKAAARVSIEALGETAAGRLRIFNRVFVEAFNELKDMYTLTLEFWSAAAASPMRERFQAAFRRIYAEFREMVAAIIEEGIKSGEFRSDADSRKLAAALVGTCDALGLQAWFEVDFDLAGVSREFLETVIRGLQK